MMQNHVIKILKEPFFLNGEGMYAMSSLKVVTGSEAYLKLALQKKLCQNTFSLQDCQEKEFKHESTETCKCIPYALRQFYDKVRKWFDVQCLMIALQRI